jgi:protein O-mannosyl-transferase
MASQPNDERPPTACATGQSSRGQMVCICAILLLAVGLVFGPSVHYDFINLDDNIGIYENPHVTHGLTWDSAKWAFRSQLNCNWDPLTWISHMADWQLWGPNAGGHHAVNIVLHAATVVLLFLLLRRMSAAVWPSALAAALFAIHPLRAESVVWVTERKDVLSGLFFMLTLTTYISYARRGSVFRYLIVMVLFTVGLLSKPVLVTVPFVMLLLDYWPLGRMDGKTQSPTRQPDGSPEDSHARVRLRSFWFLVAEKVPLVAFAGVCTWRIVLAERVDEYPARGAYWRIGNVLISYVDYLRQFFWPSDLALLYPRRAADLPVWQVVGAALILLAITAAAFIWRRKFPYLLVGWLWYLVMMMPMIGLVAFGNEAPADRFTYLPQIGIAIALVWWAAAWCGARPYRRWAFGIVSVAAVLVLMVCASRQVSFWRDSETLWKHTIDCTSDNYSAHRLLGCALGNTKRDDKADLQFLEAVRIINKLLKTSGRDGNAKSQALDTIGLKRDCSEVYFHLGVAAANRDRMELAMAYYQKAINTHGRNALAHNNLGYALLTCGEYDEALGHLEKAVAIDPQFATAHYNCGLALHALRHYGPAIAEYKAALNIQPEYALAHYNLGVIYELQDNRKDAAACYRAALKINPDFPQARRDLDALTERGR